MRAIAPWLALVLAAGALAGCVASDEQPVKPQSTQAAAPAATEEFGSVTGIVAQDEGLPVSGVRVVLLEPDLETLTDPGGAFTFNNLTAGKYSLLTEKLGFESSARSVDVVPGEITFVEVKVDRVVVSPDPIAELAIEEGFIQCSYNPYWPTNACGEPLGNDRAKIPVTINSNWTFQEVILELDWVPTTAVTGQELEMDICDRRPPSDDDYLLCFNYEHYWEWEYGPPPVVMRLNDLPVDEGILEYQVDVGSGFMSPYPTIQQDFTLYVTLCYYEDCAEDYTAIPPA